MTIKHRSKVSYGLLFFIFLVSYGPLIPVLINEGLNDKMIGALGVVSLSFGFILYFFFGTYYVIEAKELTVKCGFFSYKPIPISKIKELVDTRTLISAPAPSFDRIEIKYGKSEKMILSPVDKDAFAKDLRRINPKIKNNISS